VIIHLNKSKKKLRIINQQKEEVQVLGEVVVATAVAVAELLTLREEVRSIIIQMMMQ
jgi:hypothetical protein